MTDIQEKYKEVSTPLVSFNPVCLKKLGKNCLLPRMVVSETSESKKNATINTSKHHLRSHHCCFSL